MGRLSHLVVVLTALFAVASTAEDVPCATGVHIIAARGTYQDRGAGRMSSLVKAIKDRIPNSDSEGLVYPASTRPTYFVSEGSGTESFKQQIKDYVAQCPHTKIVLVGHSQGGQALMDTLCGTSERKFTPTKPMNGKFGSHIVAAIAYGDPSHIVNQPYDHGTSTRNGMFPRRKTKACRRYGKRLRSYCDHGDPYCDKGRNADAHTGYFKKYNAEVAEFVAQQAMAH